MLKLRNVTTLICLFLSQISVHCQWQINTPGTNNNLNNTYFVNPAREFDLRKTSTSISSLFVYNNIHYEITHPPASTVAVNIPNEGVLWNSGTNNNIRWTDGMSENVKMDSNTGGNYNSLIVSSKYSDGISDWSIPSNQSTSLNKKSKTTSISNGDLWDYGNSNISNNESPFSEQTQISLTGVSASSVTWGDYDNDGDLDILLTGKYPGTYFHVHTSKIYQNNGDGSFTEQTQVPLTGVAFSSVAWGDYDNDGDLDILLTGDDRNAYVSKIYQNNGDGSFTEQTQISLTGVAYNSVAWGDYDNDGDLDILLTGSTGSTYISKIYQNNGDGSFTEQTQISLTGVAYSSVAWGDYDNDRDLDILLTGQINLQTSVSKIYQNNGDGSFTEQTQISLTGVFSSSVAWGDYDNDGDLDILLSGITDSLQGVSIIYRNNGDGSFTEQTQISLTGVYSGSVAWGDYDNDGDLDILLTGYTESSYVSIIYRNNGDRSFSEQTQISLTGVYSSSVVWGDYDNDGDLDILLTGSGLSNPDGISKIYKNNTQQINSPPASPLNLQYEILLDRVKLTWDKSIDNETPRNSLTYNLLIGDSSGEVNILSPMSDRNNGYRRIVNLGNTNHNNSWTIKGLEPGTYYWSVQAIDNAFTGSQFSPEQILAISDSIYITINTNPPGRNYTVDGTIYTSQMIFSWKPGSSHTISTTSPQSGGSGIQYVWDSWGDGGNISHTVSPTVNTIYSASFSKEYYLTMTADTGGTVSPSSGWRQEGENIEIKALPDNNYSFEAWTGSGPGSYSGSNNPAAIIMNGPIEEQASFSLNDLRVTLNTNPLGRSFTVDGTIYTTEQVFIWKPGSNHTISTTSPQRGGIWTQYVWDNWSDGGDISHTVSPIFNATYTANFNTEYYLTMTADTGGTVSPSSGWRQEGENIEIEAFPDSNYSFETWTGSGSGSYSGSNNPAAIIMNGPIKELTRFIVKDILVTINTNPPGRNFTVDSTTYTTEQVFSWQAGSSHTLSTTSPQSGGTGIQYVWNNWSDGGNINHTISPMVNTIFTASFDTEYYLTMTADTGGSVTPSSGWRLSEENIEIEAFPDSLHSFEEWTGSGPGSYTGNNNPDTITMNGPIEEVASFSVNDLLVTLNTNPPGRSYSV
ncbi:FG-GAP-like repeat-containing protein, partial [Bacteroidota bacterium]